MIRAPWVAGVGGGVGTSTVAAAVGGRDRGVFTGRGVDVLVCRSTGESLIRATRAAPCVAADGLGEFRGDVGRVGGLCPRARRPTDAWPEPSPTSTRAPSTSKLTATRASQG
jgi:hypothetical protein